MWEICMPSPEWMGSADLSACKDLMCVNQSDLTGLAFILRITRSKSTVILKNRLKFPKQIFIGNCAISVMALTGRGRSRHMTQIIIDGHRGYLLRCLRSEEH